MESIFQKEVLSMAKEQKQKMYRLVAVSYGYIDVPADNPHEALAKADDMCRDRNNFDWGQPENLRIVEEL